MKKLFLTLIFAFSFVNAQYLIEDNDVTETSKEVGKSVVSFDIQNPLEFYRLKCLNATYAQFPGGEEAFKQELQKKLRDFLDNHSYSVNGTFDFIFFIDKNGNLQSFQMKPEVTNGDLLYRDLNMVLKSNKKWIPATCNGTATDSKLRLRVNFRTDIYDI